MTLDEAIKWLNVEASCIEEDVGNGKEILEAYDMAIEALEEKEARDQYEKWEAIEEEEAREYFERQKQPCEDCISRQALKQKLQKHHDFFVSAYGSFKDMPLNDKARVDEITNCIAMVVNEPSVTPKPKVGEWLEKEVNSETAIMVWQSARCSVCDKYHTTPYMYYFSHYDYCPHCGAQMEGRQRLD